ncbi:MAG: hypothetical protein LC104_02740 [Bacteroidales bacterium]|nr:hypothetical protein [Bacteroidales bacterium]
MHTIRLLPLETASGPANMAADEAMLHSAAESGVATLRWYQWSEPTLSLGYFQPASDRFADPRLATLAWVRRATGGSALVHHHEITYALALPPSLDWQPRGESWACRVHHAISAALASLGAKTRAVVCGEERKLGPVLCFFHQTPGDLLADSRKVVGSAQRKQKGALLQHGGILLARSEFAPDLPGIRELTGVTLSPTTLSETITQRLAETFHWQITPGNWTAAEQILKQKFHTERYTHPHWNEKR